MSRDPAQLKYAKSHEWVHLDGETATVGITEFAVKQLTDLVYIELPEVGRQVQQGESFGEVESVKAVSDLYAPVSGEVSAVNAPLADDLALLSDDALGEGWIVQLKVDNPDLSGLMGLAEYEKFCESEEQ